MGPQNIKCTHIAGKGSNQFLAFYLKIISCGGVIYAHLGMYIGRSEKDIGVLLYLCLPNCLEKKSKAIQE